jgi:hypothetical protein
MSNFPDVSIVVALILGILNFVLTLVLHFSKLRHDRKLEVIKNYLSEKAIEQKNVFEQKFKNSTDKIESLRCLLRCIQEVKDQSYMVLYSSRYDPNECHQDLSGLIKAMENLRSSYSESYSLNSKPVSELIHELIGPCRSLTVLVRKINSNELNEDGDMRLIELKVLEMIAIISSVQEILLKHENIIS